jgi:hypothetical protein
MMDIFDPCDTRNCSNLPVLATKLDVGIRHTKPSNRADKIRSHGKVRSARRKARKALKNAMYLQVTSPDITVAGISETMSKPGWSGLDATHRSVSSVKKAWGAGTAKLFPILKNFNSVPFIFYDEE